MPGPIGSRTDSPYTPAFDPSEASSCRQESEPAPSVVSTSTCSLEDGSIGLNAGIGVTAVGIEGTGTLGPLSATIGASVSANLAGSVGIRDGDHDGKAEICARAELTVMTFGVCIERPW
jgi:hypothetical protein